MDIKDLRGLVEAYQSVYVEEDVEEIDEGRLSGPQARAAQQAARERQNVQRAQAPTPPPSGRNVRGGSGRYQAVAADKGRGGDAAYRAGGGDAAARSGLTRQQIQQKGMAATKAAAAKPAPTPAAKPSPKPAPTPAAKPAAPAAAKPAAKPAATGGTKPAAVGSAAKVEPAKPAAEPKIKKDVADLKKMQTASQIRQKGANVTSDMIGDKSTAAPAPKPQMSARAQALKAGGPQGGARERMLNQSFDMFSSSNIKGMIEAYAEVYAPQELDEKTAMAKRGYDEAPIRKKIAKSTGGGKAADRATELEKKSTFGDTKKEKQRSDYARKQRGDFRKTTSSSPGLSGYAHKSDDPKVKEKQAARGAQRGALTPKEKKELNREEFDLFDLVLEFLQAEGYAETLEEAKWMMANMIDEEAIDIILEITGGKGHPGYKAGSKDHGPMQSGHPADSEKRKDKGGTMSQRHGYHLGDIDDDDEDEDELENVVKQQSRDKRETVRKPLRNKVKAARKVLSK